MKLNIKHTSNSINTIQSFSCGCATQCGCNSDNPTSMNTQSTTNNTVSAS